MAADKRTVATDALETLGTILAGGEGRDAIHLAVEPAVAAHRLEPGQHVGLLPDGRAGANSGVECVGIVDPFLARAVEAGERFWLVVYPRQITSLRHVWTHPAFPEEGAAIVPASAVPPSPISEGQKAASEAWLREFIEKADCPDYDTVIACAVSESSYNHEFFEYGDNESYFHFDGRDAHGEIPDEFWTHVQIVTGKIPPHRSRHFSCSC